MIESQPLKIFTEKAYLDYSMAVILDRALPHIGDGLKPVQRRIIYAMNELGLKSAAKHKKAARTVGDVLGKYHPHSDQACYEAMVLMAQNFSYRYPLIDGQGNWGSLDDPKSFAAMRYTESKLTAYASLLLSELEQGTVDWMPNFDGTLEEPKLLPARLPNLLLNGASGIAVGMATDIPPHNLNEVTNACIHLLENPEAKLNDILKYIKGPDFPTNAEIITPAKEIKEMYKQGGGSVRMRATYHKENGDIVIDALPYQTSGNKIIEQIASQMQEKKLPLVEDVRDESDHENPTRIVISPRSNRVDIHGLMSHLFATTELERSYRINLNVIGINGKPQVKDLLTLLNEWLEFRTETVKRRLQYRLDKILIRLHILEGLLIAYLNIDEVIKIIRKEDDPKVVLIKKFKLTEQQVEAILELKLRYLAKLEEIKIKGEQDELSKEKEDIEKTLKSREKLKTLIQKEIQAAAKEFSDKRHSPIIEREEAQAISQEKILPTEPITVILSKGGWVRAAKGHDIDIDSLSFRSGDSYLSSAQGKTNQHAIFLDSTGKSYSLPGHSLPSARGQGEPLTKYLKFSPGATCVGTLIGDNEQLVLLASDAGYGFIAKLEDLYCKSKSGKALIKVPKGAQALPPKMVANYEDQFIAAITTEGHLLIFPLAELPMMPKGKGNKIINIPSSKILNREEYMVAMAVLHENSALTLFSGKRQLTLKPKDLAYYQGERGRRGNKLPKGLRKVDKVLVETKEI